MGKFRRFIKEKCPDCGNFLEIRASEITRMQKGIIFQISQEYLFCPTCGYEGEMEQKRERRKEI